MSKNILTLDHSWEASEILQSWDFLLGLAVFDWGMDELLQSVL
jgi:hypothetical protein